MKVEKGPANSARPKAARRPVRPLSDAQRRSLLKGRARFEEAAVQAAEAWIDLGRKVLVPGLKPEGLVALIVDLRKARKREDKARAELRGAVDARMIALDAAFRALLDLNAYAHVQGRRKPEVLQGLGFLRDLLRPRRNGRTKGTSPPPNGAKPEA